jgi:hypothetical protein
MSQDEGHERNLQRSKVISNKKILLEAVLILCLSQVSILLNSGLCSGISVFQKMTVKDLSTLQFNFAKIKLITKIIQKNVCVCSSLIFN